MSLVLQKIKNIIKNPFWHQFRDVRFLGFIVFGILVLLASWNGVKVIETNYELQKQIAQLNEQNKVKELTNANLKLQNEYYKTSTYQELVARKQLGKGAPGEKLLLVPKSVALAHAKKLPDVKVEIAPESSENKSKARQNQEAWLNFFLRRPIN